MQKNKCLYYLEDQPRNQCCTLPVLQDKMGTIKRSKGISWIFTLKLQKWNVLLFAAFIQLILWCSQNIALPQMLGKHTNLWGSRKYTKGHTGIFHAWYIYSTTITANSQDINYVLVRWKIFWASHMYSTYALFAPFLKNIDWIRNKPLACIKKRLQGNIWSSQTDPCLANIQRILLPQKCEYVMYSQVTKTNTTEDAQRQLRSAGCAGNYHMQCWYIRPLWC